jgi:ClpP class serine protease
VARKFIHPSYRSFFSGNLLITGEAANAFLAEIFLKDQMMDDEEYTYTRQVQDLVKILNLTYRARVNQNHMLAKANVSLTSEFDDMQIPDNSIALHMIHGTIFADYDPWDFYFSTKKFVDDIRTADANPKIIGHLLHVNSGGGDAWYLDVAAEAVKNLTKPAIGLVESVAASAGLYLIINSNKIYATTGFDILGSIGTMTSFLDIIPYYEKLGAKFIEEYADQSKRKNKKYNDLRKGKPDQFRKEVLNPLAEEFINTVKNARPDIPDNDRGVFEGETFFTEDATSLGLIDGRKTLEDVLSEIYNLSMSYGVPNKATQKAILNLIS